MEKLQKLQEKIINFMNKKINNMLNKYNFCKALSIPVGMSKISKTKSEFWKIKNMNPFIFLLLTNRKYIYEEKRTEN